MSVERLSNAQASGEPQALLPHARVSFTPRATVLGVGYPGGHFSDPAWETLAAARDAVLAAVEAVRHVALPFLADRETRKYEAHEERRAAADVDEVDTPWGRFAVGGGGPRYAPAWVSARDAAERSREAAADLEGSETGATERSWQVKRLLERLIPE